MASNKSVVPEAKEALNRFKMEAASEVGVNLKQGYNGDLTSKQAGSVGGQMVNVMCPVQTVHFQRTQKMSQEVSPLVSFFNRNIYYLLEFSKNDDKISFV